MRSRSFADVDPTYGTPRDAEWKFGLPAIRAQPAEPGDFFIWNQAVLHWGSRPSWRERESRVSMAFEFQRMDCRPFNGPIIRPKIPMPFDMRLRIIAKQVLQFRHMYRIDPGVERMAIDLVGG